MKRGLMALSTIVILLAVALYLALIRQAPPASSSAELIPVYGYRIVQSYPHDRGAFTQGLLFEGGALYEGTGLYGESSLRRVELLTGRVLQIHHLPPQYFGEGITLWKEKILQLTWREQTGFVYDRESFQLLGQFSYSTEGWGLTHDGRRLILSDGTSTLRFLDPESFKEIGRLEVRAKGVPIRNLNELEYIKGEIWANVWQTDRIAIISPETGAVRAWLDLTGLLSPEERRSADVLNGIAYDAEGDRLFVTGKLWPKLFEVRLVFGDR